jgi:tetratricopeptide (TPR) repeat protein
LDRESQRAGVFVGREDELAELSAGLADAEAGRGTLFLLVGEPGIGKSRLADEVAALARDRGYLVLWGRCWEAGGAPAYWPWVQALRAYVRDADPEALARELGDGVGHVAQILPDAAAALPEVRLPEVSDPDSARFLLFDATTSFLLNVSSRRPILLVLDDLHVADTPSLLMLRFVARELARGRVVVVGAYRDPDPERDGPLPQELAGLAPDPATKLLRLTGLTEPDVTRFIDRTTGAAPPASLVSAVWEETEGNPLFIGEVVRLLAQEGALAAPASGTRLAIPESVRGVIGRRLEHLSPRCREVLAASSVMGREFEPELLARIEGRPNREIRENLDEATRARVIGGVPGSATRFRFAHALIRDVLYEATPSSRRIELHQRIAETLEELPEDVRTSRLAELAHHFFLAIPAGDPRRAAEYARRAGDDATTRLAYEEAARLYEMALQALELMDQAPDALRCELLVRRGEALASAGELARAREILAPAADLARSLGRSDDLARAAIAYGGWFVWQRAGSDHRLVGLLEDALDATSDRSSPFRVRLLARLACALRSSPEHDRSDSLSAMAVDLARELGDPRSLVYALSARFAAIWWPENVAERLDIANEMVRLSKNGADLEGEWNGHHCRMIAFFELGDLRGVESELAETESVTGQLRVPASRWLVVATEGNLAALQGRLDDAERHAGQARDIGRPAALTDAEAHFASNTYRLRRERGRPAEALDQLRSAAETFTWYPFLRCELADLYLDLGNETGAREIYRELAARDFEALPRDNEWIFAMTLLAPIAVHLGDMEGASAIRTLLLPFSERHAVGHSEGTTGSVSLALGILATTLSRFDDAERDFTLALQRNEDMGALLWTTYTQIEFARMLFFRDRPGDHERADELLSSALPAAEVHGFVRAERQIETLRPTVPAGASSGRVPQASGTSRARFRREGEYWSITFGGDGFRLRHSKGLRYLSHLLARPGIEIHSLELVAAVEGHTSQGRARDATVNLDSGDPAPLLDDRAKAEYRTRLGELDAELSEAEEWNDPERASRLREERDFLAHELASAIGLGGRDRKAASNAERARVNVTRAIRSAIERIDEHGPDLGKHLSATVRTGTFCSYQPDPRAPVTWST